jgi:hypothetical protein
MIITPFVWRQFFSIFTYFSYITDIIIITDIMNLSTNFFIEMPCPIEQRPSAIKRVAENADRVYLEG